MQPVNALPGGHYFMCLHRSSERASEQLRTYILIPTPYSVYTPMDASSSTWDPKPLASFCPDLRRGGRERWAEPPPPSRLSLVGRKGSQETDRPTDRPGSRACCLFETVTNTLLRGEEYSMWRTRCLYQCGKGEAYIYIELPFRTIIPFISGDNATRCLCCNTHWRARKRTRRAGHAAAAAGSIRTPSSCSTL